MTTWSEDQGVRATNAPHERPIAPHEGERLESQGTRLRATGPGADPRTEQRKKRSGEKRWCFFLVPALVCVCLLSFLGLGLSGSCWSGACRWSLSGVAVVVSPFPVFRQVQIEGSCTCPGATLRTGRVMSGIHKQCREVSRLVDDVSAIVCSYVYDEPSCGVEAWHAGDCDPGF